MQIPNLFHTSFGMYLAQSLLHALLATLIAGAAIEAWKIESPRVRQRFRLTVILFAIFSFPLYHLMNSERNAVLFRSHALFDSFRWLDIELLGVFPMHLGLALLFGATTLVFFFQEMVPIVRHFLTPSVEPQFALIKPADDSPVGKALRALPRPLPDIFIIHEDEPMLFSTTKRRSPAIYLTTGLAKKLTGEQLRAAVAHEMAHIARSRPLLLIGGFLLRSLMCFNPVVLVEFRRAIRNEEKICDDIAVGMTGNAHALAEALRAFYAADDQAEESAPARPKRTKLSLEEYSHNLQLHTRIARLEKGEADEAGTAWFPFVLSFGVIAVINYFIV